MLRSMCLIVVGLACFAMSTCTGCWGGGSAKVAEVKGQVTLDGKPGLAECSVTFVPEATKGTKGPTSGAKIEADGQYVLLCGTGQKGAVVGFHKVVIRPSFAADGGGSSPTGTAPAVAAGPKVVVPRKYTDINTTDLLVEVKPGTVNEIALELKSK